MALRVESSHLKANLKEIIYSVNRIMKVFSMEGGLFVLGFFGFHLSPGEIYPYVVLRAVMHKNNKQNCLQTAKNMCC